MSVKITNNEGLYDCFKCKCPKCGVEFEYTRRDIRAHRRWPNGFVYCPRCKIPVGHDNANFSHNKLEVAKQQQAVEDEKPSNLNYEEYLKYRRKTKTLLIPMILFLVFGISFMISGTVLFIVNNIITTIIGLVLVLSGIALIVVRAAVFTRKRRETIVEVKRFERQHPELL